VRLAPAVRAKTRTKGARATAGESVTGKVNPAKKLPAKAAAHSTTAKKKTGAKAVNASK